MPNDPQNLFITGAAGFIGSNLVGYFLKQKGARVLAYDKLTYAGRRENIADFKKNKNFSFVRGDITDQKKLKRLFQKFKPTAVLNLAAETHVDRSIDGPEAFVQTNLVGTFRLMQAAKVFYQSLSSAKQKRFRFLHVSTDEVFGSLGKTGLFREDTPYRPNSPYAASKAGADHLVRAFHRTYNFPTLITNCSNNYGPRQFPEKLIPLMILNALIGQKLPIYGDGQHVRDWLYVEDHCSGIDAVLKKGKPGESYNIGGSSEETNLRLVKTLVRIIEKKYPAKKNALLKEKKISSYQELMTFVQDRPGHDRRYGINARKIKSQLKWKPRFALSKGLEKTVDWYLNNLDWATAIEKGGSVRQRIGLSR